MKFFKTQPSRLAERYEITTKDSFEEVTEGKSPFVQKNKNGELRQYAICPSCLNPIQIIGLYKPDRKYGKHTGESINGLPTWNQYKYEHCPYATLRRATIDPNDRLNNIDDSVKELYQLLKSQFDRVVYILERELGIKCSNTFWKDALNQFIVSEGYLYPWLTESNLPYIFAYFGLQHQNMYNQQINVHSELFAALSKYKGINFIEKENSDYCFLTNKKDSFINIRLRFINHKQSIEPDDSLNESIRFCVDDDNKTIYEKTICFDERYFMNMVKKEGNDSKRSSPKLQIAQELMHDI